MRTRIYNARILTMEPGRKIFSGEIGIEDGRIISVREEQGKEKEQAEDRAALRGIIESIIDDADRVDTGDWRGQPNPCTFYLKGNDLVIVNAENEFVTIMKGGGDNKRYRNAIGSSGD